MKSNVIGWSRDMGRADSQPLSASPRFPTCLPISWLNTTSVNVNYANSFFTLKVLDRSNS